MSQENVDRYKRSIDAWNRGDLDGWLGTFDRDFEWRSSGVFPGLQPVYHGVEGARRFWSDMRGPWKEVRVPIERTEDLGEPLLALITFNATGRNGITTSRRWAQVERREGGKAATENY